MDCKPVSFSLHCRPVLCLYLSPGRFLCFLRSVIYLNHLFHYFLSYLFDCHYRWNIRGFSNNFTFFVFFANFLTMCECPVQKTTRRRLTDTHTTGRLTHPHHRSTTHRYSGKSGSVREEVVTVHLMYWKCAGMELNVWGLLGRGSGPKGQHLHSRLCFRF